MTFRFGSTTARRRLLALRLRRWLELARAAGATRLLVDGSFLTSKPEPKDVDAAILLTKDHDARAAAGDAAASELTRIIRTRRPEELFAAYDEVDWDIWVDFFARTRERDDRRKGIVVVTP